MRAELGRPLSPTEPERSRVMERVRAVHAGLAPGARVPGRVLDRTDGEAAARSGRGSRSRLLGLALAAGLSGVMAFEAAQPLADASGGRPRSRLMDGVAGVLADTLEVVRFMFIAPTATRVALVGDFNRWDPKATPLVLASDEPRDTWTATVPLRIGRHRYAFVVDDTQWVADPMAARREYVNGRRASVLDVPRARE